MRPVRTNVILFTCLLTLGFTNAIFAQQKSGANTPATYEICKKYLSTEGLPLEMPATPPEKLNPFLTLLHEILKPNQLAWPSDQLAPQNKISLARFQQIAGLMKDPESQLNRELAEHIAGLGGYQSRTLWDAYFHAYDKIAAFSDGILTIATTADEILPKAGVIGDFGAGTGNVAAILAMLEPKRQILALDFSEYGLKLAETKLQRLTHVEDGRFETRLFDLTKDSLPSESLDGAVMNNVLYTLGENKAMVLKNVFKALKPGAPFVLADVVNLSPLEFQKFLIDAAVSAIKNGAPITEYDIALSGKINVDVLLNEKNKFSSPEELKTLAEEAGFELHGFYKSYHGASMLLYLTKPK